MASKPTCLVCQKEMIRGFISDEGHPNSVNLPRWCEGDPKPGFASFGDATRSQVRAGLRVVAFRCPECEALRLYAPSAE